MATYKNTFNGHVKESDIVIGYPWVEIESEGPPVVYSTIEPIEFAVATADAILAQVGNDAELAQLALDAEAKREKPRTVLTAKLQRIVDNASS